MEYFYSIYSYYLIEKSIFLNISCGNEEIVKIRELSKKNERRVAFEMKKEIARVMTVQV